MTTGDGQYQPFGRRTTAVLFILMLAAADLAYAEQGSQRSPGEEFPFQSRYVDILGSRMHYIDEGAGNTFLFLHGNPTSSYLWRNVIPYVSPRGRVVAVDNVGFGRSDKPSIDYSFQSHSRYLDAFINELDLEDVILVVHDWGSVLGLNYAVEHPGNVRGVVFMEAIIPPTFPMESFKVFGPVEPLFRRFRDPVEGKKALMEENLFVETLLAEGTITRELTDREMLAYRKPFPTTESRYPIYRWPNELPIAGLPARNVEVVERIGRWLRESDTPKLLQYASPGVFMPPAAADWAAQNYRNIETQFVGRGRHFIQEDNPEAIGRGIVDWHRRQFSR